MATLPPSVRLGPVTHVYQSWNNCGPATVAMAVSILGTRLDQREAARQLKPDPEDKNVSPEEMAAYIAGLPGLGAADIQGADLELLRRLLAAGFPVIAETWFEPDPGDEMGHYRLLVGYEGLPGTAEATLLAFDSYLGPDRRLPEATFDAEWRSFNRRMVVPHRGEDRERLQELLGPRADAAGQAALALERAENELAARPDAIAWFNLGSSALLAQRTDRAAEAFDQARALGLPWRMLWYQFGPFEAYAAEGRWEDLAALAEANLRNASNLEESLYWRARAEEARGDTLRARASLQQALRLRPDFAAARKALDNLAAP